VPAAPHKSRALARDNAATYCYKYLNEYERHFASSLIYSGHCGILIGS